MMISFPLSTANRHHRHHFYVFHLIMVKRYFFFIMIFTQRIVRRGQPVIIMGLPEFG